jgi:hypothetical protein
LIRDADLSNLPKEVIDSLVAHTCENKVLQKKYDTCQRILGELIELEAELTRAKADLNAKRLKETHLKRQSDDTQHSPK